MDEKNLKKYWIISVAATGLLFLFISLFSLGDKVLKNKIYTVPIGETGVQQQFLLNLLWVLLPYLALLIGYGLAYLIVRLYAQFSKISQRIEFMGFARVKRSRKAVMRRYIYQLLYGVLLCMNIFFIFVQNENFLKFWVAEDYQSQMYHTDGRLYNFPMVPWYWVPLFITVFIFTVCWSMIDSGLVSVKKIWGYGDFLDTERVGSIAFGIVKGYAGISVIITFLVILQSPLGLEGSLVVYPLIAFIQLLQFIIAIDLSKNIGRKLIWKGISQHYRPKVIELNFQISDVKDFKDLFHNEE